MMLVGLAPFPRFSCWGRLTPELRRQSLIVQQCRSRHAPKHAALLQRQHCSFADHQHCVDSHEEPQSASILPELGPHLTFVTSLQHPCKLLDSRAAARLAEHICFMLSMLNRVCPRQEIDLNIVALPSTRYPIHSKSCVQRSWLVLSIHYAFEISGLCPSQKQPVPQLTCSYQVVSSSALMAITDL